MSTLYAAEAGREIACDLYACIQAATTSDASRARLCDSDAARLRDSAARHEGASMAEIWQLAASMLEIQSAHLRSKQ